MRVEKLRDGLDKSRYNEHQFCFVFFAVVCVIGKGCMAGLCPLNLGQTLCTVELDIRHGLWKLIGNFIIIHIFLNF